MKRSAVANYVRITQKALAVTSITLLTLAILNIFTKPIDYSNTYSARTIN